MCFVFPSPPLPFVISPEGSEVGIFFLFFFFFHSIHPQIFSVTLLPDPLEHRFARPSPSSPIKVGESVGFVVPLADCLYSQVHSCECEPACVCARAQMRTCAHMLPLDLAGAPKSQVLLKIIHSSITAQTRARARTSRP